MTVSPGGHPPPDLVPLRRALLSVFDKTGLVDLARALAARGVEIVSTGGTKAALAAAGIAGHATSPTVTGFPEIMDGRVKTLHPAIHGGLLGVRDDPAHTAAMETHGIAPIDLLVVNLYPFEDDGRCRRRLRHRGREHRHRRPGDDPRRRQEPRLRRGRRRSCRLRAAPRGARRARRRHDLSRSAAALAAKAFARTAAYDAAISAWFAGAVGEACPAWRSFGGRLGQTLRYGENPHQSAALYLTGERRPGVATARQVQGKELSYNNINDTDAAYELVAEFDPARAPRWRSSSTPIPAASRRRRRSPRPTAWRSAAIPSRPSAASSRSTARSTPKPPPRSPRSSPR